MEIDTFNMLVNYIVDDRIKKVMCAKSKEYARGGDKLWNFKASAKRDNISPEDALRGMDLKHRQSIADMLEDLKIDKHYSEALWAEKLTDHLNYTILLWGLLSDRYNWSTKGVK